MMSNTAKNDLEMLPALVEELKQGNVIAYPTEAVFGLGCDPDNEDALRKVLELKQRPWHKGLILIAGSYAQLKDYVDDSMLNEQQKQTLNSTWPGPISWVMPIKKGVSKLLTGQFDSLAVRVTTHPDVIALCNAFGKPIVSTSANLSGLEPCRTYNEVLQQFGEDFPVLRGEVGKRNKPSEVRNILTGELYRQG